MKKDSDSGIQIATTWMIVGMVGYMYVWFIMDGYRAKSGRLEETRLEYIRSLKEISKVVEDKELSALEDFLKSVEFGEPVNQVYTLKGKFTFADAEFRNLVTTYQDWKKAEQDYNRFRKGIIRSIIIKYYEKYY